MALSVKVAENGDHQIGQKVEGAWITYLRVPAFRVAQALEAAKGTKGDTNDDSTEGGS